MRLPDSSADSAIPDERTPSEHELTSHDMGMPLSAWSRSRAKRMFDVVVILAFTPVILPLLFVIGVAVRLCSGAPIIFRQARIGRFGRPFTILKFRTMLHGGWELHGGIASVNEERITPVGRILRRLKVDELPQFVNVLRGDMSLVGPRPRIAEQQTGVFSCRPGITGPATLAFAREDILLSRVPPHRMQQFYREKVLPAKHQLDSTYMARATMGSDMRLLLLTAIGRWQDGALLAENGSCGQLDPHVEVTFRLEMETSRVANGGQ